MAKCSCAGGDVEVECKCGCGCICVGDDPGPEAENCSTFCFSCPPPKGADAAALGDLVLGFASWSGARTRPPKVNSDAKISICCKKVPLGGLAMAIEKATGMKLAAPTSTLAKKHSIELTGRIGDVVKRLGLIELRATPRPAR